MLDAVSLDQLRIFIRRGSTKDVFGRLAQVAARAVP